ncbi:hypothetical protein SAMN05421780_10421 [Flexibacter flexilis DSM 6793]|uniref:Methyltransferase domain-containing protein n=1 Tax=Flexibacter flexilis DSM 6793 TaxID=927664 RepID=A0A1I1HMN6_9BACT|nr:hypothetical protein SAMN05421780_10421 [Flexibacter flexilis DSM 6793]
MKDSTVFYFQSADSVLVNQNQLNKAIRYDTLHFGAVNKIIGTEKETSLPNNFFDKIILHYSFYSFFDEIAAIENLKTKLKPNGIIIISDDFSSDYRRIKNNIRPSFKSYLASEMINGLGNRDLYLTTMSAPENSFQNNLCFGLNKEAFYKLKIKRDSVAKYIKILDQYNLSGINSDAEACATIATKLKPHIKEILKVYPSTEMYFNALGYRILQIDKKPKVAINIFKANVTLFPESWNVYDSLGEAYFKAKNMIWLLKIIKKHYNLIRQIIIYKLKLN